MKVVVVGLVSASLLLAGCQEKKQVVAKVADENISKTQFEAYLKHKHIPTTAEKRVEAALDQYLEREALAKAIEDSQFLDNELTAAELNEFRKQMLISRYFEKYLNQTVSEDALRNYYAGNPDQFQSKRVNVAHILLRVRPKMSEQEIGVVKTKAYEAYSKLRANENFEELAKNYSEDRLSAEKNGELGWIKEGTIDSEFSKVAFSLKEGEFSKPIRTPFGFHIIKQLQAPQVVKQPFEAVKGDIRYQLRAQAKQAEYEKLLKQVKVEKIASSKG
ncbi:peptidylprolyl isomerase [Endozoicomonas sp. SM1973]|uniref:Peptidylprolyl isomerase n=1 Tax=Spartinivicinus marinus TaxID=2994442 RepID=A0A853HWG4_9GAMM|nr:peptidylprolyl isomerase [Spartinivicinus marinus]MCX4028258.1 peptidylprolyl isomerase [Spartinivicinus marinus]NYZ65593.1 peptidylprolyl isomerase [Spartinivicinus marinus]